MTSKYFDPHTSFLHLPIVKFTAFSLVAVSLFWGGVIVVNSKVDWDLSYIGFNHFLVVFRFPLGILAIIIPVIALLAANHRSEQTKEQIKVTNEQNIFSNYYKHIDEFSKYIALKDGGFENGIKVEPRYSHSLVFPYAKDGDYSISNDLIEIIIDLMLIPLKTLNACLDANLGESMDEKIIERHVKTIRKARTFLDKRGGKYNVGEDIGNIEFGHTYLFKSREIIEDAFFTLKTITYVCEFSPQYKSLVDFIICNEDLVSELKNEIYVFDEEEAAMSSYDARSFEAACYFFREIKKDFLNNTKGMLSSYYSNYIQGM